MRGLSKEVIVGLVKKDVVVARKNARAVILLDSQGNVEVIESPNGRLGVIAVIGPGEAFGEKFSEALLLEIGIRRSRPYHEAFGLKRREGEANIHRRRNWFQISKEQYGQVAPLIFALIGKFAKEQVEKWRSSHYSFWTPNRRYVGRKKKTRCYWRFDEWPRGVRFTVSCLDELVLADVFFAERYINRQLVSKINSHAYLIHYVIRDAIKRNAPLLQAEAVTDLGDELKKATVHIRKYILGQIPRNLRRYQTEELETLFGISLNDSCRELELIGLAGNPGKAYERIGDLQLKVTTGLESKRDYVVFEVFPYTDKTYVNPEWLKQLEEEAKKIDKELGLDQIPDCPF
jgi:hypothetical protein